MSEVVNAILGYLEYILILVLLYLYSNHNRIQDFKKQFKILYWYFIIELLILIVTTILTKFKVGNLFVSHIYFISQFIILSLFYKSLFSLRQKQFVNALLIIVLSVVVGHFYLNPDKLYKFNALEIFLTSIPLVIYSIIHLYNSLTQKKVFIYVNVAILMYLSSSTLIFILGDILTSMTRTMVLDIWIINRFLYIGYLVLYTIEYRYAKKR